MILISKEFVTLALIISFTICTIIVLLYNSWLKRTSSFKSYHDVEAESNFLDSKIDENDIKIICK